MLAGRGAARLQDQLVEGAARFYEFSVLRQNLLVRDEDVGSLAQSMLTARYAMHGEVELRTAIPARDGDDAAMQTKRFQHLLAQHHQTDDNHGALWRVVDAILDGGARAEKLSEGEVSGEEHLISNIVCVSISISNWFTMQRYEIFSGLSRVWGLLRGLH